MDRQTKDETTHKHLKILVNSLEEIKVLLNVNCNRLKSHHKTSADAFYLYISNKLTYIAAKKAFDIKIPSNLHDKS